MSLTMPIPLELLIPPQILIFFAAMLPIGELRAAIPLGLFLGISPLTAFFWSELGNILMVMLILKVLGPISTWLIKHSKWCDKNFNKLFHHTRSKHLKKFKKIDALLLILLAAIPLPGTGGWTGALLGFLFDIPYWKAIIYILIGNIIAGILVTVGIGSAMEFIKLMHH